MNTQSLAKAFGIIFLIIGVLGFIPGITVDGNLLGIFAVDVLHNIVHLATGLIAFLVTKSLSGSKTYFKVFGIIYALVAVLGLMSEGMILGLIHANSADDVLHIIIAVVALYAGFRKEN